MAKYVELAYPIYEGMPVYPGLPQTEVDERERIANGDPWNGSVLKMYLHAGTHVDAPFHHDSNDRGIDQVPIEDFIYESPLLLDVELGENEYITVDMLKAAGEQLERSDMLIFNTGYWKYCNEDFVKYSNGFPALSVEATQFIRTSLPVCKGRCN
ncbi:metal-dependent hydrolase [Geomicrobium sp. JCM 19037]|uniref:cyclase family protein n=1 Tax=Geomicrobium sp. JCM 19037 TaxID=1460634 RepID=UPI00045F1A91|nr:cyclase family protein [Geomicrobium sp. JCM 19037]GAK04581.1 metal-dependent hydrolase [Geomicrobium sp. JCM 19037]